MAEKKITKSATEAARQLYLYGAGDGKRVVSVQALCAAAGVCEDTIRKHLPAWQKEAEEILANTSKLGLAFSLSEKDLNAHNKDMIFLRGQINSIKWEMDNLDNVIDKLERICENFSLNTDNGDDAIKLFDRYLRASANKSALRGQFLALEKQWTNLAGIVDLKDIAVVRSKELSKGQAKMDLKDLENSGRPRNANSPAAFFGAGDRRKVLEG